jgi:biotin synthase
MTLLHPLIENAYRVLNGEELTEAEAMALVEQIHGTDIPDLISLANKVRNKFAGEIIACSIINAKSGHCNQNCRFCAQAQAHNTEIETYDLLDREEILSSAQEIYDAGVRIYGIVTSGYGYKNTENAEFKRILEAMDELHERFPGLKICASLGILSDETAKALMDHHLYRYNMNLQTNPERYSELISRQHTIEEKIDTIRYLQKYGATICCGGIFGLGETWRDRIRMAVAVRELGVDGSPLNILLPIPGTPLENEKLMTPADAAKAFAIFRLVNPKIMLKFAAGRETTMKDFQGLLMLAGMNSMITGGYLTTRGRSVEEDRNLIDNLNLFAD